MKNEEEAEKSNKMDEDSQDTEELAKTTRMYQATRASQPSEDCQDSKPQCEKAAETPDQQRAREELEGMQKEWQDFHTSSLYPKDTAPTITKLRGPDEETEAEKQREKDEWGEWVEQQTQAKLDREAQKSKSSRPREPTLQTPARSTRTRNSESEEDDSNQPPKPRKLDPAMEKAVAGLAEATAKLTTNDNEDTQRAYYTHQLLNPVVEYVTFFGDHGWMAEEVTRLLTLRNVSIEHLAKILNDPKALAKACDEVWNKLPKEQKKPWHDPTFGKFGKKGHDASFGKASNKGEPRRQTPYNASWDHETSAGPTQPKNEPGTGSAQWVRDGKKDSWGAWKKSGKTEGDQDQDMQQHAKRGWDNVEYDWEDEEWADKRKAIDALRKLASSDYAQERYKESRVQNEINFSNYLASSQVTSDKSVVPLLQAELPYDLCRDQDDEFNPDSMGHDEIVLQMKKFGVALARHEHVHVSMLNMILGTKAQSLHMMLELEKTEPHMAYGNTDIVDNILDHRKEFAQGLMRWAKCYREAIAATEFDFGVCNTEPSGALHLICQNNYIRERIYGACEKMPTDPNRPTKKDSNNWAVDGVPEEYSAKYWDQSKNQPNTQQLGQVRKLGKKQCQKGIIQLRRGLSPRANAKSVPLKILMALINLLVPLAVLKPLWKENCVVLKEAWEKNTNFAYFVYLHFNKATGVRTRSAW